MPVSDEDFKRIRLFELPPKRTRGRPYKLKTGLPGRPRKFPCGTLEYKMKSLTSKVFMESEFGRMIHINDLTPSFVKVFNKDQTTCCKLYT